MLASQLFWRIFAVYAALTVISTLLIALMLSGRHRAVLNEQLQDRLRDEAAVLLTLGDTAKFSADKLPAPLAEARLVQSEFLSPEAAAKSSHGELQQAVKSGEGFSERRSGSGSRSFNYALRIGPDSAPTGYLRVWLPKEPPRRSLLFDLQFWGAAAVMIAVGPCSPTAW